MAAERGERVDELVVAGHELGGVGAQRALGVLGAVRGVLVESLLEAGHLVDALGDGVQARVDGAVEDHRTHPVGIAVGVGGAELGAVGEAEEVDLASPSAARTAFMSCTAEAVPISFRKSGPMFVRHAPAKSLSTPSI